MTSLIMELRKRGYDRRLRAGLQIGCLVLSRSEKHGLLSKQPRLSTNLSRNDGLELHYRDVNGQIEAVTDKVDFTPELESLLERLAAHPID